MAWAREVFHRLPTGLRLAPDRRATWLLTLGGWAIDLPHLLPWSDGTMGMRLSPLERLAKLAALMLLPRMHLVGSGGCLVPHSHLYGRSTSVSCTAGLCRPE